MSTSLLYHAFVARHLQVSWDVVKGIVGDDLRQRFARPKLRSLKRIAIDEIYLGKKHKFLTIVMDLDRGAIVFVGDGKGEKSLEPLWKRLRHSRAKIQAVAADLSPAYSAAIGQNLLKAKLVFGRFPLVKLLNEHLTDLRRELHREATDQLQKQVLKGTRWLLLKRGCSSAARSTTCFHWRMKSRSTRPTQSQPMERSGSMRRRYRPGRMPS